jgi:hypothetical protein
MYAEIGGRKEILRWVGCFIVHVFPARVLVMVERLLLTNSVEGSDVTAVVENRYIFGNRGKYVSLMFLVWMFCLTMCLKGTLN